MLDFTSSHYLGLHHPSATLAGWPQLTTGRPAALDPLLGAGVAARLARLLGTPDAVLARSTLHAGWDLGTVVGGEGMAVLVDAGAYPTSDITALVARRHGSPVVRFAHHDPAALDAAIRSSGRRSVALVDTWCPGCGGPAPLREYRRVCARHGGLLAVDATQTVGVIGGAGGSDIVVASLAKAFGAPLAVIAGPPSRIDAIRDNGPSRTASSPPTAADLAAASAALDADQVDGDAHRTRLWSLVRRFRRGLWGAGAPVVGDPFPVQPVGPFPPATVLHVDAGLRRLGIRAVPQLLRCRPRAAAITFVLTAAHRHSDVDTAVAAIAETLRGERHAVSVR